MSMLAFILMVAAYIAAGVAVYVFIFIIKREDDE